MIKAIIFDFDGVLAESAEIKTWAFKKLFEKFPEEAKILDEYHQNNMGISRYVKFRYFYEEILGETYSDEIEKELSDRFSELVFNAVLAAPAVKGATEFLMDNYRTLNFFIASGTPEEELVDIVNRRNLTKYFKGVYGTPRTKDVITESILNEYGYSPEEIVFVGDASSDRRSADKTGTHFVARITGDDSPLHDCEVKIDDLSELSEAIKRFNHS